MNDRSCSEEHLGSVPDAQFSRSLSHESALNQNKGTSRKSSFCVPPNVSCRRRTISSHHSDDENPANDGENPGKMIKNTRELLVLIGMSLINFTATCSLSLITPFFTPEAKDKGASSTVVGLIFGVYPLVVFCLSPLVGKWMPRIGVKFCLIAGCFLEGGTLVLFGFVADLPSGWIYIMFCFLIRIVTAIGSSMSATASLSILTVTFKDHIGTVFGITETFTGLGFMVGPALGGILYQHGGFRLPFLVCGGLVLSVLLLVFFILPGEESFHTHNEDGTEEELASITQTLRVPGVTAVGFMVVTAGMALSFLDPTLTPFVKKVQPDVTIEQIGFIFFAIPAAYILTAPVVGCFVDNKHRYRGRYFMIAGQLGLFAGYFFMGPSPIIQSFVEPSIWLIVVSGSFLGLLLGPFIVPSLGDMQLSAKNAGLPMTLGTDSVLSGIFNGFFSIGNTIGPTLGSVLSDYWSFEGACTVFAFLILGEAVFLLVFTIWERNSKWGPKNKDGFKKLEEVC